MGPGRLSWMRLSGVALGFLAFIGILVLLRSVVTIFAIAFALAYFLNPVVNVLEHLFAKDIARSRWLRPWLEPRVAAVALLAFTVLAALVLVVLVVIPLVSHQIAETAAKLPEYARTIRDKVEPTIQKLNLRYPEEVEEVRQRFQAEVRSHLPQILSPLTQAIQAAFSSLLSLVLVILQLIVIPIFTLYLLNDMNRMRGALLLFVPERYRPYASSRVAEIDRLLSAFVRGQLVISLVLGVFYSVALTLCGVPMGVLVGFLVGLLNIIPYMVTIVGLPVAVLLHLIDKRSLSGALTVALVFAFGQLSETHFLTPRIVGHSLGIHPVVVMLAVLVGGTLFGLVGMLVAVPTTAALSVFWADLRDFYFSSRFYRGGGQAEST